VRQEVLRITQNSVSERRRSVKYSELNQTRVSTFVLLLVSSHYELVLIRRT